MKYEKTWACWSHTCCHSASWYIQNIYTTSWSMHQHVTLDCYYQVHFLNKTDLCATSVPWLLKYDLSVLCLFPRQKLEYTFDILPAATPDSPRYKKSKMRNVKMDGLSTSYSWAIFRLLYISSSSWEPQFCPFLLPGSSPLKAVWKLSTELQVSVQNHRDILTQQQATTCSWD